MQRVERLAGVETDHQRLRRREQTAAVEHVAQAAAGEPLADHVEHVAVVPAGLCPSRAAPRCWGGAAPPATAIASAELGLQLRHVAQVGVHQLEHDRALQLLVERLEDGGFQAAAQPRPEAVAPGDDPRRRVGRRWPPWRFMNLAAATAATTARRCEFARGQREWRRANPPSGVRSSRCWSPASSSPPASSPSASASRMAVTGDDRHRPARRHRGSIRPARSATQVPAQTQVFVDLLAGYTGRARRRRSRARDRQPRPGARQRQARPADHAAAHHHLRTRATPRSPSTRRPTPASASSARASTSCKVDLLEDHRRPRRAPARYTWTFTVF